MDIGYAAGYSNTSGTGNTNIGYYAGNTNTTGTSRVMVGYEAGLNNTGSNNVFLGKATGKGAGSGAQVIAIGQGVMETSSQIDNSVLIGNYMAANCTSGAGATIAIGANCLAVTGYSGEGNTVIGHQAGNNLSSGDDNVLLGRNAGDALTTSEGNVAIGADAFGAGTSKYNVAIGKYALRNQNRGSQFASYNVAIGYNADANPNTSAGYYRTIIGGQAGNDDGYNVTNIGYGSSASASNANNEITLGNSSITALRCAVTSITSLSDERDKSEIEDLSYGLAFIDALQPREFVWDNRPETDVEGKEFYSENKGKKDFGFIAQEVKELDNDTLRLVYEENSDKLELSYGKLVPILVKAIQELKEEVEILKSQNK